MTTQPIGPGSDKKWPEGAIEDWVQGASYGWIGDKYGRAYVTVSQLIRRAKDMGAERVVEAVSHARGGKRGGFKALGDRKPISYGHHSIGIRLNKFREIDNDMSYQQLADLIQVNRLTVRKMELGLHDFTVRELQHIASLTGSKLEELMKPFQ